MVLSSLRSQYRVTLASTAIRRKLKWPCFNRYRCVSWLSTLTCHIHDPQKRISFQEVSPMSSTPARLCGHWTGAPYTLAIEQVRVNETATPYLYHPTNAWSSSAFLWTTLGRCTPAFPLILPGNRCTDPPANPQLHPNVEFWFRRNVGVKQCYVRDGTVLGKRPCPRIEVVSAAVP